MMKRILPAVGAALAPSILNAHEASFVAHLHPHGGEMLLAILALAGLIFLWRIGRS